MRFYFDANATTPLAREAREAWLAAQDGCWQNSSSLAGGGVRAHVLLEDCRSRLAERLPQGMEVVFTSGATEANNAVFAYFSRRASPSSRAVISAIEHASVAVPASGFFKQPPLLFPANAAGVADVAALRECLRAPDAPAAAVVSLMAVNNETGVLQPVCEARQVAAQHGVPFHCDASQAFGKLPPKQLREMLAGCDFVTGCAHKFGGPKGVGFLALNPAAHPDFRMQMGGGHENHRRAGTPDVPAVAAMLAALEAADSPDSPEGKGDFSADARQRFEARICAALPGARVNGAAAERVWNTVSLTFPNHENLRWLKHLERRGFVVGIGAACAGAADDAGVSQTLLAMGLTPMEARRTIRISAWRDLPHATWDALCAAILDVSATLNS